MSKCSKTLWTCSNGLIMHLDQVAQVGEQVNLINVPQNPSCPEPSLNNFTLATFSFWSQLLWTCSEPQMMTLHQVVHQGEYICMTKSWEVHFWWFLGFTKVALATFPKWTQSWWNHFFSHAIWPCQASWQGKSICLSKPASNTFWQKFKMHVLAISTNLHELNFFPQPHLVLL